MKFGILKLEQHWEYVDVFFPQLSFVEVFVQNWVGKWCLYQQKNVLRKIQTIIWSDTFYFCIKLSFYHCVKLENNRLHFRLEFQKINPCAPSIVINNGKETPISIITCSRHRSPNITMYQRKNKIRNGNTIWKRQSLLFC